jgi:hypothetical protein
MDIYDFLHYTPRGMFFLADLCGLSPMFRTCKDIDRVLSTAAYLILVQAAFPFTLMLC